MCHHSGKDEMQERIYSARKEIAGSKKKKKKMKEEEVILSIMVVGQKQMWA